MARAVESLQAQTLSDWELIIVNDASPDNTAEVAARLAADDGRIRVISLPENGGASVARNTGFAAATGTWIAIIDADDAYAPDRLQRMVDHAETHGLDMVADNQLMYDAGVGRVLRQGFASRSGRPLAWDLAAHFTYDRPKSSYFLGWSKILIHRAFWQKSGLHYRPEARYGQDYLFYAELLAAGAKAEIIPYPGYLSTLPRGEVSRTHSGQSVSKPSMPMMVRSSQWLRDTYGARMSPRELALAKAREREMQDIVTINTLFADWRQGRRGEALRALVRNMGLFARRQWWVSVANLMNQRWLHVAARPLRLP
jgi:succinoglycan biosynthesis protein ExoO